MPTKLFLKLLCASYTTKLTSNLKQYDSTTGYLELRLISQFPSSIEVQLLHQVKTRGCLLAAFEEKPAELAITPELVPPLPAYLNMMMSAKRCGLALLLLNINRAYPRDSLSLLASW